MTVFFAAPSRETWRKPSELVFRENFLRRIPVVFLWFEELNLTLLLSDGNGLAARVRSHLLTCVYGPAPVVAMFPQKAFAKNAEVSTFRTCSRPPDAEIFPSAGSARLPSGRMLGDWICLRVPSSFSLTTEIVFGVGVPLTVP